MFDNAKCPIQDKNWKKRQKNVSIRFRNVRTFVVRSVSSKSRLQKKYYVVNSAEELFEKIFSKTRNTKYVHKMLM
jgi:hypothetical protein